MTAKLLDGGVVAECAIAGTTINVEAGHEVDLSRTVRLRDTLRSTDQDTDTFDRTAPLTTAFGQTLTGREAKFAVGMLCVPVMNATNTAVVGVLQVRKASKRRLRDDEDEAEAEKSVRSMPPTALRCDAFHPPLVLTVAPLITRVACPQQRFVATISPPLGRTRVARIPPLSPLHVTLTLPITLRSCRRWDRSRTATCLRRRPSAAGRGWVGRWG